MKIAVLISGGVDSSVALALLREKGHDVVAFYLKIWLEDELAYLGSCPWQEDLGYIEQVCKQLGVPLEVISLQKEYQQEVVAYTIAQVKAGRTPNPDILCNQRIKFGLFFKALPATFDTIATGHYAQVRECNGVFELFRSPDGIKDQTYFLSYLSQEQLSRTLFPIGHLHKWQVRELAVHYNLPNQNRKDSQGICFLGKLKYADFIKHHVGQRPGDIVEFETGKRLGTHQGFWYHTIGQRHGSGLSGGPWYVVSKDVECNVVYMSCAYHEADKNRNVFTVDALNWIAGHAPRTTELAVKLRHGAHSAQCTINCTDSNSVRVQLAERDQGIAAGQFAVFYQADTCLGAGVIAQSL